ncbi:MAG: cytochrome c3 family protein [bacterium]
MTKIIAPALIVCALVTASVALSQSFGVKLGATKGPQQPIEFSHRIHAGVNQMDCLYCHSSAANSPWANIPAVSQCMGCHTVVATDKPEIVKLTDYWTRGEQVPWVKVHKVPDHVRFNHKRHVRAGIECQTCHGPVETMDRVYQYSSLKMGWCVTCHRQNLDNPTHPASMDCLVCHH